MMFKMFPCLKIWGCVQVPWCPMLVSYTNLACNREWVGICPEDEIAHFRIAMFFEVYHHKLVQEALKVSAVFLQKCHRKKVCPQPWTPKEIRPTANQWSFGGEAPCRRPLGVLDAWSACSSDFLLTWRNSGQVALAKATTFGWKHLCHLVIIFLRAFASPGFLFNKLVMFWVFATCWLLLAF